MRAPRPMLQGLAGLLLVVGIDALLIVVARLVDPGAPVIMLSNLVAVFIGAIQLVWALPLALWLRRRRPALAAGVAVGMVLVLLFNVLALFN